MYYKNINSAILYSKEVPQSITRDSKFYNYLLSNSVAYYYCKYLSKKKTPMDEKIISAGEILNNKFVKTLKLLNKITKENNIKFLLFKTYKYIPEIVDGDIDIFIQKKNFYKFLEILTKNGFRCFENEIEKAICEKEGYCKVEPRVNAAFHKIVIINDQKIWNNKEQIKINGIEILKVSKEIDLLYLLLSILYGPNYLKLYLVLVYKKNNVDKLYKLITDRKIEQDLKLIIKDLISDNIESKRLPLFLGNITFILWWYKRIFFNPKLAPYTKLKHILFFFYSKYSYILFNKLVFKHQWPI